MDGEMEERKERKEGGRDEGQMMFVASCLFVFVYLLKM